MYEGSTSGPPTGSGKVCIDPRDGHFYECRSTPIGFPNNLDVNPTASAYTIDVGGSSTKRGLKIDN